MGRPLRARPPYPGHSAAHPLNQQGQCSVPHDQEKHMFLVMGITGKVGGATAEHLLAHGKEVRALVRNREKAANWANQGVELVDGDWNDFGSHRAGAQWRRRRVRHVAGCLGALARFQRSKGCDCKLCRRAYQGSAATGGCAFVDGCEQDQRAGDDHRACRFSSKVFVTWHRQSPLCAQADSSKIFFTAYRSPRAERYRSTTIRQTGNRPWSRRTISARRSQHC